MMTFLFTFWQPVAENKATQSKPKSREKECASEWMIPHFHDWAIVNLRPSAVTILYFLILKTRKKPETGY